MMSFFFQSSTKSSTLKHMYLPSAVEHTTLFSPAFIIIFLQIKQGKASTSFLYLDVFLPNMYIVPPTMETPSLAALIIAFCSP